MNNMVCKKENKKENAVMNITKIKLFIFDIDGVITDGKKYTDGLKEWKSLQMKDIDALNLMRSEGYYIGCISGEETQFSRQFEKMNLDFISLGCNDKMKALMEAAQKFNCSFNEICYVGDGKYDIPVLKEAGLSLCPNDAIAEAKKEADIVLRNKGGEGCIAELYSILKESNEKNKGIDSLASFDFKARMNEHSDLIKKILLNDCYICEIKNAASLILNSYLGGGKLFLCGNGGSAGDAQHLAAELVGRFYMKRKAWSAEALTTNTSVLTALANDYSYDLIFARQIEAKADPGDVLMGISTSGTSKNVVIALKKAKELGVSTILLTGAIQKSLINLDYVDCCIEVPSDNTPRIQEMHILIGHMICEAVELILTGKDEEKDG